MLILMIIMGTVLVTIALALGLISINATQTGFYQDYSNRVFFNLDGCSEEALVRVDRNSNYTGGTVVINNTTCTITVSGSNTTRTINVSAVNGDYTRALQMNVTIFPNFTLDSWQELTT